MRLAEREGFEPSKQVTPLSGLANRRTRPLCDLSQSGRPMIASGFGPPCLSGLSRGLFPVPKRVVLVGHPVVQSLSSALHQAAFDAKGIRSEERRVGKECRCRWAAY